MNMEAAALIYVRHVLGELDVSPAGLAKRAGISASTLTRALNDPKHKFTLSMKTIEKIATASGINPAPFFEAKDSADLTSGFHHRTDVYEKPEEGILSGRGTRNTLVVGDIAAGKWHEPSVRFVFDYGPFPLTSTHHAPAECFAFIVRDDSANMIADEGEILFCVRAKPEDGNPFRGTGRIVLPVVVERRSKDQFKVELTAMYIKGNPEFGYELFSARGEDYPKDAKKNSFKRERIEKFIGNKEIAIVGVIQWVVRDTTDATNFFMFEVS